MSKNNRQEFLHKMEKQRQRFGLRKLNVGVASVLLGTTFILGSGTIAHADNNATPQSNSDNELASDTQSNQQLQSKEFTLQSGTKNGGGGIRYINSY